MYDLTPRDGGERVRMAANLLQVHAYTCNIRGWAGNLHLAYKGTHPKQRHRSKTRELGTEEKRYVPQPIKLHLVILSEFAWRIQKGRTKGGYQLHRSIKTEEFADGSFGTMDQVGC